MLVKRLEDRNSRGRERPWKKYKEESILLSKSFKRIGQAVDEYFFNKSFKVKDCGNFLEFVTNRDKHRYLTNVYFCKDRLCPICNWRRSLLLHSQLSFIMEKVDVFDHDFFFLTLTIKNPDSDTLSDSIDVLLKGWNNFSRTKIFKDNAVGYFKALEVKKAKNNVDWHPHLHVLVVTKKGNRSLLVREKISIQWEQSAKLKYAPIVDCKPVYDKKGLGLKSTLLEVSKYAVKTNTVIIPDDQQATDHNVSVLSPALRNRRVISFGGILRKIKQELKLEEIEESSLINVSGENEEKGEILFKEWYLWNYKLKDYVLYKIVGADGKEILDQEIRAGDGGIFEKNHDNAAVA